MPHQEWYCTQARAGRGEFLACYRCNHEGEGCGLRDYDRTDQDRLDREYEIARDAVAGDLLDQADPPAGTFIPGIGEV